MRLKDCFAGVAPAHRVGETGGHGNWRFLTFFGPFFAGVALAYI